MSDDSFAKVLNDFEEKRKTLDQVCDEYNKIEPTPTVSDQEIEESRFFKSSFPEELTKVLKLFVSGESLNGEESHLFGSTSAFLFNLLKSSTNASQWLTAQKDLIQLTNEGLNNFVTTGRNISAKNEENPNLDSFGWLLRSFEMVEIGEFLENLLKIFTSPFYMETLKSLRDQKATTLSPRETFLLVTCPNYIFNVEHQQEYSTKIVEKMFEKFVEIFEYFLPHIKNWSVPIILSLVSPIKFLAVAPNSIDSKGKEKIYETISTILENKDSIDFDNERARNALIYYTLCLLLKYLQQGQGFRRRIQTKTDETKKLVEVLKMLAKTELNKWIRLKAMEIVSLILSEQEFLENESPESIAGFYIANLSETLQNGNKKRSNEILTALRDMIQNDDIKKEFVKQEGLPVITKFATQAGENPLPLEIVYGLTFNSDARKFFSQDQEFLAHVRALEESNKRSISQIAHGIMWKLEGEEKFRKHEQTEPTSTDVQKDEQETDGKKKYDIMISYCWAQKEICHKINDRLEADGFQVWLDRDEMYGSIIEAMAEAIENSRYVLICMSSNYKKSVNCKSEAEYAYNRKSKIIPLVVEAGYQAEGWLGLIAGSKIYVDFADKEGAAFDDAYKLLIAELERNDSSGKSENATSPSKLTAEKPAKEEAKPEEEKKRDMPLTKEYLNLGSTELWTEINVQEFLNDHKLDSLFPVCENMDGPTLMEFFNACQTSIHQIFPLLNQEKGKDPITFATLFKFVARLRKFLPPPPQQKLAFQYKFLYPENKN